MSKHAIFHIEGGIGKHVASTAVVKAYKNKIPIGRLLLFVRGQRCFSIIRIYTEFLDWVTYLIFIKIIYTVKM